ncbi:MAG: hypothetical protein ACE5GG_05010 [Candidatus Omnitrophota bacterium]
MKAISILKLIICVLLLPVSLAGTSALLDGLHKINDAGQAFFWSGVFGFFVVDLVICRLSGIYKKGQRLVEVVFGFLSPLLKVAPYLFPVWTIAVLLSFLSVRLFVDIPMVRDAFLFLSGFSLVLHLVYSVSGLRARGDDFLRAGYFFLVSFVYPISIFILAVALSCLSAEFSLGEFCRFWCIFTRRIYSVVLGQLFINP